MKKGLYALILIIAIFSILYHSKSLSSDAKIQIHAHRGGAALYPENTTQAMLNAVDLGVPVLELDLHITKDSLVVVSHDAWLKSVKAVTPEGKKIDVTDEMSYNIYTMNYDSLRQYSVGVFANPAYPQRVDIKSQIPLVSDMIDTVEKYVKENGLTPVSYNIEIKSDPSKDGVYSPTYDVFADLCMKVLLSKKLGDRLLVQCFDVRTLNYLNSKYKGTRLSYLTEVIDGKTPDFDTLMSMLEFVPQVYSPESCMLTKEIAQKAKTMGMELAPWTVDDEKEALRLKNIGVEAIITNKPDSMMKWLGIK